MTDDYKTGRRAYDSELKEHGERIARLDERTMDHDDLIKAPESGLLSRLSVVENWKSEIEGGKKALIALIGTILALIGYILHILRR